MAIASGTAFLVAQLVDVFVFNRMRGGKWWSAPLASTLIGSALDTALFFTIAFAGFLSFGDFADGQVSWATDAVPFLNAGPLVPLWVSLAVADWGVKLGLALVALIPFRLITSRMTPSLA